METLSFNIKIYASRQKVWDVLWTPESYETWTKFFACNSTMQSDWKEGGITYFYSGPGFSGTQYIWLTIYNQNKRITDSPYAW